MKRITCKGIAATVLAVLAMSGQAAAFTPVPIPMPRVGTAAAVHVAHEQAQAATPLER